MPARGSRTQRRIRAVLRRTAKHPILPYVLFAIGFATALTMSLPLTGFLLTAVVLSPWRWRFITVCCALGSGCGGVVVYTVANKLATEQLAARYPDLVQTEAWQQAAAWIADYGVLSLFAISAGPLPLGPAILVAAAANLSPVALFMAIVCGKILKYGLYAWIAVRFTHIGWVKGFLRRNGVPVYETKPRGA
jgi:membrane protein YqaA with SNARE-associated domain